MVIPDVLPGRAANPRLLGPCYRCRWTSPAWGSARFYLDNYKGTVLDGNQVQFPTLQTDIPIDNPVTLSAEVTLGKFLAAASQNPGSWRTATDACQHGKTTGPSC
jgi:hypothetical protein